MFTQRSVQPFIRDVFDQFSETSSGGAFTFMTGIGGFLQEFLYGYSGLRFDANAVEVSPLSHRPARGNGPSRPVVARATVHRRHRPEDNLDHLVQRWGPAGDHVVRPASDRPPAKRSPFPLGRPDLAPTTMIVRCGNATASSLGTGRARACRGRREPGHGVAAAAGPGDTVRADSHGPRSVATVTHPVGPAVARATDS